MFTLKLAWNDADQPDGHELIGGYHRYTAWLSDVSEVRRLRTLTVWDYDSRHYPEALEMYDNEIEYYCPVSREKPADWNTSDPLVFVLGVTTPKRSFLIITEFAWLLGPNGDTIERVAP